MAVLDGLLYVVCELSSDIHVFNTKTHKRFDDIRVADMEDPNDIAACTATRQLYIADCRTDNPDSAGCMWKVSPSGTVSQWQLAGGVSPYSLSVRKGRILVTPLNDRQLFIYNAQQQIKKKIPLPGRMEPRHAVETSSRTVIVLPNASIDLAEMATGLLPCLIESTFYHVSPWSFAVFCLFICFTFYLVLSFFYHFPVYLFYLLPCFAVVFKHV